MAIKKRSDYNCKKTIDLTGPNGNAFYLLGYAKQLGRDLGFSKEKQAEIIAKMTKSDYENLIKVFDNHFGDYVDLLR
jgi:hypothetical protein